MGYGSRFVAGRDRYNDPAGFVQENSQETVGDVYAMPALRKDIHIQSERGQYFKIDQVVVTENKKACLRTGFFVY